MSQVRSGYDTGGHWSNSCSLLRKARRVAGLSWQYHANTPSVAARTLGVCFLRNQTTVSAFSPEVGGSLLQSTPLGAVCNSLALARSTVRGATPALAASSLMVSQGSADASTSVTRAWRAATHSS